MVLLRGLLPENSGRYLFHVSLTFKGDYFILYTMFRNYHKEDVYSYSLGAFPTLELVKNRPDDVVAVLLHSKFLMTEDVRTALGTLPGNVSVMTDDKSIERITNKGNVFMIGVFNKREFPFSGGDQIVLYEPSDAGNLGTIIRTAVGFGVKDIAVIGDGVDVFDPKTVRASMGAIFRTGINRIPTFEEYARKNPMPKYLFMLGAKNALSDIKPTKGPCAYIFGNEASGLPETLAAYGTPVVIKHSGEIDSLALPQAVAIGLYHFTNNRKFK